VYHPGPKRRSPHTWEKSGSSDACCHTSASHGRTIGRSTYVWAFGLIALASDAVALSRPNGGSLLGANHPCGSSIVGDEGAQGTRSPNVAARSSWRRAVIPVVSARGAVGSCVTPRLARTGDREEAEEWWRRYPCLFLGGEAWWRGRLGALNRAGIMRAPPGPLTESRIMS